MGTSSQTTRTRRLGRWAWVVAAAWSCATPAPADETLRIQGHSFRPKVFRDGTYTIHVGDGPRRQTLSGIESIPEDSNAELPVNLEKE